MKAVIQDLKSGAVRVEQLPAPQLQSGGVLVRTRRSLISLGTERAVMALAKKSSLGKARDRPDLAQKVLNKAKQEGYWSTYQVVKNLIASPIPLGYSCAGEVVAVGEDAAEFAVGDRVACAGLNFANHAEVNYIPRNLAAKLPEGLPYERACFVTVGVIALHGVRLAEIELGDVVVVMGLGLVGQIAAQLVRAAGATVVALDLDADKVALAQQLGAHHGATSSQAAQTMVGDLTGGHGADSVVVCAASKSDGPLQQAVRMCRIKGRVVLVGDTGMKLRRRPMFEKEVELVVSRSYGPGRYDPQYELRGVDYPRPYVRWTERRNMQAFVDLLAREQVNVDALVTHRYPIAGAEEAYKTVNDKGATPPIAILIDYPDGTDVQRSVALPAPKTRDGSSVRLGVIGAGQFAKGVLLPAFKKHSEVSFEGFCTASGLTSRSVAENYGARFCASDPLEILDDPEINAVLIATRHDQHARLTAEAIKRGKAVFVEKPLAITTESFDELLGTLSTAEDPRLMVGFNRRFSPLAAKCRSFFEPREGPLYVTYRVNAGAVDPTLWVLDPKEGGGRILGEGCHFVDTLCYLTNSLPSRISAIKTGTRSEKDLDPDGVAITLLMEDGSVGVIHYVSSGDPSLSKEFFEMFGGGRSAAMHNYRSAVFHSGNRAKKQRLMNQQKGHADEVDAFVKAVVSGAPMPIDLESLVAVTQTGFLILESLGTGSTVSYRAPGSGD